MLIRGGREESEGKGREEVNGCGIYSGIKKGCFWYFVCTLH